MNTSDTSITFELTGIPDGFRRPRLTSPLTSDSVLPLTREGHSFVAEIASFDVSHPACRNHLHISGNRIALKPGDRVPLILAYRRSMVEFASGISDYLFHAGDTVWILSGYG